MEKDIKDTNHEYDDLEYDQTEEDRIENKDDDEDTENDMNTIYLSDKLIEFVNEMYMKTFAEYKLYLECNPKEVFNIDKKHEILEVVCEKFNFEQLVKNADDVTKSVFDTKISMRHTIEYASYAMKELDDALNSFPEDLAITGITNLAYILNKIPDNDNSKMEYIDYLMTLRDKYYKIKKSK